VRLVHARRARAPVTLLCRTGPNGAVSASFTVMLLIAGRRAAPRRRAAVRALARGDFRM